MNNISTSFPACKGVGKSNVFVFFNSEKLVIINKCPTFAAFMLQSRYDIL